MPRLRPQALGVSRLEVREACGPLPTRVRWADASRAHTKSCKISELDRHHKIVARQPAAQESAGTTTTVVRPGESLWEIAAASGTADVSGMVTRIVELNDLRGTTVHAGQTLEIPAA